MSILNNEEVGNRIVELQKKLNINSRQMAISIDGDASYLSKIEKGKKAISKTYIDALIEKHNVNKEWLLFGKGEMFGTNVPHGTKKDGQIDIQKLIDSNYMMAEAMLADARSREKLTDSNAELVRMVSGRPPIENVLKETTQVVAASVNGLREFVLEQFVKKHKFHSFEEAEAVLDKKIGESLDKMKQDGIQIG